MKECDEMADIGGGGGESGRKLLELCSVDRSI